MSGNTFGKLFTLTSFGESHGPAIGGVIDGCPPGLSLNEKDLQVDLDRRKPGTSKFVTQRKEDDLMTNSEMFVITVEKGSKVKIQEINLYGVESIKEKKLKRAMKDTKEKAFWRIFKRSKFSISAFERDKKLMIDKFKEIGYRDAEIRKDSVYLIDDKNLCCHHWKK